MTPDGRQRVEAVALEALARGTDDRAAYLDGACAGDPDLRRDVESLLAGQSKAAVMLESPPWAAPAAPPLATGTRLGPYTIEAVIGAGGMGEVYKARDTRLGRTVAIKVLPPSLAADPERRRRFEHEARAVSALNHPHICPLFDIGEAVVPKPESRTPPLDSAPGGPEPAEGPNPAPIHFLVLAHLEGQTLAARLQKSPLPLAHVLDLGAQIADALSAAHKAGIIHRDLKPANVMLTKRDGGGEGRSGLHATLLDFGLAKLAGHGERPAVDADAATASASLTKRGMILGTVPYMAPEQVEGKAADARTDVWALGAVLYEMLSRRRAFEGDTPTKVAAAILEHDPPPLGVLQPAVPPSLVRLITKCLAKDPDARWDTAHDITEELRWIGQGSSAGAVTAVQPQRARLRRALGLCAGAVVIAGAGAVAGWLAARASPAPAPILTRTLIDVRPADELSGGVDPRSISPTPGGTRTALAWTPDGQALIFIGTRGGVRQLYVRRLDATEARPLAGTEGAQTLAVSPDGQWVLFFARGAIRKLPLAGGPAAEVVPLMSPPRGFAWDARGRVYFGQDDGRIWVASAGGAPEAVTTLGDGEVSHRMPLPLPGDRVLVYSIRKRRSSWGDEEVVAQTLATGARKMLLRDAVDVRYLPRGYLLFLRRGTLFAVGFDAARAEIQGEAVAVLDGVAQTSPSGPGQLAVSPTGTLAWIPGQLAPAPDAALVAVDRNGHTVPLPAPHRSYGHAIRPSPDGRRLAVTVRSLAEVGVWLYDVGRGTLTPLAGDAEVTWPLWSPDGQRLWFSWLKDGRNSLAALPADGGSSPQAFLAGEFSPSSWAPDKQHLAAVPASGQLGGDIFIVSLENGRVGVRPWLETPHTEYWPAFSPDGLWLAYGSNVSGRFEVYVRPYPGPGSAEQVSIEGGQSPAWSQDGAQLYFVSRSNPEGFASMMVVDLDAGSALRVGRPRALFRFDPTTLRLLCAPVRCYDLAPEGGGFYAVQSLEDPPPPVVTHINLIENWFEELKTKVRVR